jgi:hypothetical protein
MRILDRLPLSETRSEVWAPDQLATVKPYQIVVMIGLTAQEILEPGPGLPRFPAILDKGNNHNLAIREHQLRSWTRITPIRPRHPITVPGRQVPLISAALWLFPNDPGKPRGSERPPVRLAIPEGVADYPEDVPKPARLPILGLRALVTNGLKLIVDGKGRVVSLKTSG